MRQNAVCVHAPDEHDPREIFFMTAEQERKGLPETIAKIITALRIGDFMDVLPLGNEGFYLYSTRGAEGKIQTVTRTHVRLPKLSHLITLSPRDFFLLLNLIATAKNTQTGDSLALNPAACGVTDINNTAVTIVLTMTTATANGRRATPSHSSLNLSRLKKTTWPPCNTSQSFRTTTSCISQSSLWSTSNSTGSRSTTIIACRPRVLPIML